MIAPTIILASESQRAYARQIIDELPAGSVVSFRDPTRTLEQNAKMWAMLADISRAEPFGRKHTPDDWKCIAMNACGWEVQFLPGLSGYPFPIGYRSSKLSKRQMAELIEWLTWFGDTHGVVWSNEARA